MRDYEILGQFYLGKQYNLPEKALQAAPILYDSTDLTTHALIIGMTGSGKTGLGMSLLEEALIDNIPLIAIDPKGDIANLLLTFDELTGDRFLPWIDPQEAATQGLTSQDYAAAQAELWEKGLGEWGQDVSRIQRLRQQVEMAVYTPGSSAGLPISLLDSFDAPAAELLEDIDLMTERVGATATSLLSLLDIDTDPVTSREHILISNLLTYHWNLGQNLDIASLIQAIQIPPMDRIGVMDLNQFYPAKDRMALAMRLNNLLASPGFAAWRSGEPLDIQKLLYTPEGKARAAIFSIGHLDDRERMFFVTMLLNQLLSWMRSQSGTSSLRAMLYMDEIMGYLPPVANPPSKKPMLTLLKQARAFGLGLVLATQNPVDLDYKALSNIGTWFIGRLQTERDRARVLEGLQGADGEGFDAAELQEVLSNLGKRVFLLRNVHEAEPVIFQTRWALSYLRGPLTREQIKQLMATMKAVRKAKAAEMPQSSAPAIARTTSAPAQTDPMVDPGSTVLPEGIEVFYAPAESGSELQPWAIAVAQVHYSSKTYDLDEIKTLSFQLPLAELSDAQTLDWCKAQPLAIAPSDLQPSPPSGTHLQPLPDFAQTAKPYSKWQTALNRHIREVHPLELIRCKSPKLVSQPGEAKTDFLLRVRQKLREERDTALEKMRDRYATKLRNAEKKLMTAEERLEREQMQAQQRQLESAVAVGSSLLGAFMGRRRGGGSGRRAVRAVGRLNQDRLDIEQAQNKAALMADDLRQLEEQLQTELSGVEKEYRAENVEFEKVEVGAKVADVEFVMFGLLWQAG